MPRDENIKAIELAAERFTAKDLEGYLELYDRGVLHHGVGNMKRGVGGLREHFQKLLVGFPDLRIDSQDIFGDGEKVPTGIRSTARTKASAWVLPPPISSSWLLECCFMCSRVGSVSRFGTRSTMRGFWRHMCGGRRASGRRIG